MWVPAGQTIIQTDLGSFELLWSIGGGLETVRVDLVVRPGRIDTNFSLRVSG